MTGHIKGRKGNRMNDLYGKKGAAGEGACLCNLERLFSMPSQDGYLLWVAYALPYWVPADRAGNLCFESEGEGRIGWGGPSSISQGPLQSSRHVTA